MSNELSLTPAMWLMLIIAVVMLILMAIDRLRSDIVAMTVLVVLGLSNLLAPTQIFLGFSSDAVISIIAVMIIAAGLEKTGLTGQVSSAVLNFSKGDNKRVGWILSLISGLFAGLLRSMGAFALLLPVINRLAVYLHIPKSRLLMPAGFCAIVGGTLTLIGSGPLIILNGIMSDNSPYAEHISIQPLSMFTVFPIGLCLLLAFIFFFLWAGKYLLPDTNEDKFNLGADISHFRRIYGFGGGFFELRVLADSPLKDITLSDIESKLHEQQLAILAVSNNHEILMPPLRRSHFSADGYLALLGSKESVETFAEQYRLQLSSSLQVFADILNPMRSGFSEVVIPPGSPLIGKEMRELHMRRTYSVQVLSVFRDNEEQHGKEMMELTLRSGDTLGLFSEWHKLAQLEKKREFALVTTEYPRESYLPKKRWHALGCVSLSLILVLFLGVNPGVGMMAGALGMLITGVLEGDEAYHAVSWKTVFLLAGLVPFGLAMQSTGTATWIANNLLATFGNLPPWLILTGLAVLASLFSLVMTNVGSTVVLVPIAIHLAVAIHADPRMFAIVVAIASSNSFLIPTNQVNALIAGPGGYQTRDFLKIGSLATLLYLVILMPAAYLFL